MIALPDVDTLMAGGLQDRLDSLVADRAKAKEKMIWTGAGGIVAAILVGFIFYTFGLEEIGYFAATVVGGGALAWASNIRHR
jgi:hypothetical protein